MTTSVSIIIVAHDARHALRACLESVAATVGTIKHEIIVVDNASTDDSADMVAREFPRARLVRNRSNRGFAAAANQGARSAVADFLLFLNPDTRVHPGAIAHLLAFAEANPAVGVLGGRLLHSDGTVDPESCWGVPTPWSMLCFGLGLSTAFRGHRTFDPESLGPWPRDTVQSVGVVTGCLMLVPRSVWQSLAGFDERFWLYSEDVDLALRARAAGLLTMITPDATATHDGGGSSTTHAARMHFILKGRITYIGKHWSRCAARGGRAMLVLGVAVRATAGRLTRGPRGAVWRELWQRREEWACGYASSTHVHSPRARYAAAIRR